MSAVKRRLSITKKQENKVKKKVYSKKGNFNRRRTINQNFIAQQELVQKMKAEKNQNARKSIHNEINLLKEQLKNIDTVQANQSPAKINEETQEDVFMHQGSDDENILERRILEMTET